MVKFPTTTQLHASVHLEKRHYMAEILTNSKRQFSLVQMLWLGTNNNTL